MNTLGPQSPNLVSYCEEWDSFKWYGLVKIANLMAEQLAIIKSKVQQLKAAAEEVDQPMDVVGNVMDEVSEQSKIMNWILSFYTEQKFFAIAQRLQNPN